MEMMEFFHDLTYALNLVGINLKRLTDSHLEITMPIL